MKKQRKNISPCFNIKLETDKKLDNLQKVLGIPKSAIIEISIGVLNEFELQERKLRANNKEFEYKKRENTLFPEYQEYG